jgi:FkbM family methyltransferase
VDGGCYNGLTALRFAKWCGNDDYHVYAWEPSPLNRMRAEKTFRENDISATLIPKGLWSEAAVLSFNEDRDASAITEAGASSVEVDGIDNLLHDEVTFIKMDIEGSEYKALLGAKDTIAKYKPKLAICVYHKPEDIWQIPLLIHEINPDYTYWLRHYSYLQSETVLYAL